MAKRLPERYKPGDLDRTRQNIGALSKEEADRMSELLGGEVGVEKTDETLQQKYDSLRDRAATQSYAGRKSVSGTPSRKKKEYIPQTSPAFTGHYVQKKKTLRKISYFDRIKIDRIAAKPEHKIKTRADVVSAYLSFIIKSRDRINPDFIAGGDHYYYIHIEALVTNLESLLKQVRPSIFKSYINPYYRNIFKVLLSWDLKELNTCLSALQKSPRNRDLDDCGRICRLIYTPIILMGNSELKHLYAAADRLYKVMLLIYADEPDMLISIKNRYLELKEKIKTVFKDVAYTCYPLLLKLTGTKFYYYREFMRQNDEEIVDFLNIDRKEILIAPTSLQELGKKQLSLNHLKKKLEKEKEELLKKLNKEKPEREASEIMDSLELLERLFPESNWKNYNKFPDFYPYFHPLFKFPKGTELIASEDPLQQVVVLASIIGELLYGFRSINIKSEHKKAIEAALEKWHLFTDELIQNHYNKLLVEYCRNVEKGTEYSTSKFGQKLLTDIYWFKRRFILPHIRFKVIYKSESIPLKTPKFHEQTSLFYRALQALMEEFDNSKDRQTVIENYNTPFHFEIKNITSNRLKKILEKDNIAPTNENLLRYSLILISVLDFLINSGNSPYYSLTTEDIPIYRYDPVYQGKPLYSVPLINTEALLKKY